jgi:hypothetical protein
VEKNVTKIYSLKRLKEEQEVRELYKLASNPDLREKAIKLLQNAINKKRSEEARASERAPITATMS